MKIRLFFALFLSFLYVSGQDQAPNIKVTDIFGNFITSSELQLQNKYIFIDFFTNGCSSCQYEAPFVDSVFKKMGCNCNNVYFLALNKEASSTNENVFAFTQTYGLSFPAVSADGGSNLVAENFDVTYTPYWILINPDNEIEIDTFFWISSASQLEDTLANHGLTEYGACQGTEFNFGRIISGSDTAFATIDKNSSTVIFNVPQNFNTIDVNALFVISPNAKLYLNGQLQNPDSSVIDLTDTLVYTIIAEDSTFSKQWKVFTNFITRNDNISKNKIAYFNSSNSIMYLSDYKEITYFDIFSIDGKLLYRVIPTQNNQDLNVLHNGIYLINFNLKNGKTQTLKILKN